MNIRRALAMIVVVTSGCDYPDSLNHPDDKRQESVALSAKPTKVTEVPELRGLLFPGKLHVDVMGPSPRMTELSARLQAAIAKDPKWWLEHVKSAPVGEPVAYDSRLGFSQEEFTEYLRLVKSPFLVFKSGDATLTLKEIEADRYLIDGGPALQGLTDVEIDFRGGELSTPFGVVSKWEVVDTETSALGAWKGIRWDLKDYSSEEPKSLTGTKMRVCLGRLMPSGRGLLLYDVSKFDRGKPVTRVFQALTFDAPKAD